MVRKTQMHFKVGKMASDLLAVFLALGVMSSSGFTLHEYLASGAVVFFGMALMQGYRLGDALPFWSTVARAVFLVPVALLVSFSFYFSGVSGVEFLRAIFIGITLLIFFRILIEYAEASYYRRGRGQIPVLVVGMSRAGEAFLERHMNNDAYARLNFVGFIDNVKKEPVHGVPYLGKLVDLEHRIESYRPEAIVHVGDLEQAVTLTTICQRYNLEYFVLPALLGAFGNRVATVDQAGFPLLTVRETNLRDWNHLFKRCFDLFFGMLFLILFSPIILLVSLSIMLERKTFYPFSFEERIDGRTGEAFRLWRFKTLKDGVEEEPMSAEELRMHSSFLIQDKGLSKTTRLGKLLRKTELNELPQLFNVMNNSMSLIGPRPPFKEEIGHYTNLHKRRLRLKPGITGLWQVEKDSTKQTLDDLLKLDIFYVENWSLVLDFFILAKTAKYVILHAFKS